MPKSNRLAGEDFQDFQKKKTSRHRRWSVVPSMRRQLAATRRDPETASGRHYQGPIISQDGPNPGGWAACTAALSSPPVSLTTSNNGRSGAAKQPAQPKKTYPSSQSPAGAATPILGSRAKVQNRNAHGKGGCYIPYTRYRRKKRRRGPSLLLLRVEVGRSESDGGEV